jgi:hypothetical protein
MFLLNYFTKSYSFVWVNKKVNFYSCLSGSFSGPASARIKLKQPYFVSFLLFWEQQSIPNIMQEAMV